MKIALCFHGYLRNYELSYKHIIESLNLDDYDIFIYTNKNNHIKHFESDSNKSVKIKHINTTMEDIKNIYGCRLKSIKFAEEDDNYLITVTDKFTKLRQYYIDLLLNNKIPAVLA
jgi:hypothetical protein